MLNMKIIGSRIDSKTSLVIIKLVMIVKETFTLDEKVHIHKRGKWRNPRIISRRNPKKSNIIRIEIT